MTRMLSDSQIQSKLEEISTMSHYAMGRAWRFAPIGQETYFNEPKLAEAFTARFKEFGGWTPELSKQVGW